ncbi:GSU3473 family protein [Geomonas propionica]|uniref:Uncharacterized protein n=1 Tax=Geomonas propionica TaxID=2798582 RepID=A0ABS0YXE4_9BACT|nr:hypothetical protein [Geomonas propionica]MBJ6802639.1 hypothetical protein [Geomonas propionica]
MGVLVCYDDFTYDVINDYFLDHLLSTGCIIGYDRSGHWSKKEEAALPTPFPSRHISA